MKRTALEIEREAQQVSGASSRHPLFYNSMDTKAVFFTHLKGKSQSYWPCRCQTVQNPQTPFYSPAALTTIIYAIQLLHLCLLKSFFPFFECIPGNSEASQGVHIGNLKQFIQSA